MKGLWNPHNRHCFKYACVCETPRGTSASAEAITYYLAKDRVPINASHNGVLKKMINTLNKCYIIPSCNFVSKAVLRVLCTKCGGEFIKNLKKTEYFLCYGALYQYAVYNISSEQCIPQCTEDTFAQGLREVLARILQEEKMVYMHGLDVVTFFVILAMQAI